MKSFFKLTFFITCVLASGQVAGQELYLSWKRMVDITLYRHDDPDRIARRAFATFNLFVERPLENKRFSVGIDLAYSNYNPALGMEYDYLGSHKQFYDRSFSVGAVGRFYTLPKTFRMFMEAAVYGNYIRIHQPVVIKHSYGTYHRIIDSKEVLVSGSLAIGFSVGNKRIRWEPYSQWGIMPEIENKRAGLVAVSSIGMVKNSHSWLMTPLVLKVMLF